MLPCSTRAHSRPRIQVLHFFDGRSWPPLKILFLFPGLANWFRFRAAWAGVGGPPCYQNHHPPLVPLVAHHFGFDFQFSRFLVSVEQQNRTAYICNCPSHKPKPIHFDLRRRGGRFSCCCVATRRHPRGWCRSRVLGGQCLGMSPVSQRRSVAYEHRGAFARHPRNPEALTHSPSQMPLSCPVAPQAARSL